MQKKVVIGIIIALAIITAGAYAGIKYTEKEEQKQNNRTFFKGGEIVVNTTIPTETPELEAYNLKQVIINEETAKTIVKNYFSGFTENAIVTNYTFIDSYSIIFKKNYETIEISQGGAIIYSYYERAQNQEDIVPKVYFLPTNSTENQTFPRTENLKAEINENEVKITAKITDKDFGNSTIVDAELFIDNMTKEKGQGIKMSAEDGNFDAMEENVIYTISNLSIGKHVINVHGKDSEGNWGIAPYVIVEIKEQQIQISEEKAKEITENFVKEHGDFPKNFYSYQNSSRKIYNMTGEVIKIKEYTFEYRKKINEKWVIGGERITISADATNGRVSYYFRLLREIESVKEKKQVISATETLNSLNISALKFSKPIEITKIELGYYSENHNKEQTMMYPCWIFYLDNTKNNYLCVNAFNSETLL